VESVITTAASATEEAPARMQILKGVFMLMLLDSRRITIQQFYQIETYLATYWR
jgi:hypothetical protein